jgi:hypothetical protein
VHGNVHARFGGGDTPYPKGSTVPTLRLQTRLENTGATLTIPLSNAEGRVHRCVSLWLKEDFQCTFPFVSRSDQLPSNG